MSSSTGTPDQGSLEERIEAAFRAGDPELAVTVLLRGYGPELLRFLAALHRDEDDAAEVFSLLAEAVWKAAPAFERRCSARTWAYTIARRVSLRYRSTERRRGARFRPFAEGSSLAEVEAHVRTETLSYLRTERRARFTALREALPLEDQMLLMLRVDRQLAWNDLAIVLHEDEGAPPSGEALKREAARLRKRFQVLKEKLREAGRREGLVGGDPEAS